MLLLSFTPAGRLHRTYARFVYVHFDDGRSRPGKHHQWRGRYWVGFLCGKAGGVERRKATEDVADTARDEMQSTGSEFGKHVSQCGPISHVACNPQYSVFHSDGFEWSLSEWITRLGRGFNKIADSTRKCSVLCVLITRISFVQGRVLGITIGCLLGMCPLYFMNEEPKDADKKGDKASQKPDAAATAVDVAVAEGK